MESNIIAKTIAFVKSELKNAEGGHDWWHVYRVWKTSKEIAKTEKVNLLVVELSSLLHDIADSKFHMGDETIGIKKAKDFLNSEGVENEIISQVISIIENISFKGGNFNLSFTSPELMLVQDADRLDAIGAIGIARAFNYGGFKNRELFNPEIKPNLNMSKEEYKKSTAPTINHFYEKLLLLKDRMNTAKGKELAIKRHEFMETYLEQFYNEFEGNY
ncbi:MAG TPA: phosphohydrolase [Bacteroidales bacterium]|nr:MAG: phosphohydrolase [Bacteroidetes bacterium GWF2_33_38]OFY76048.1 MAG: phosphohydrolase [Bacteroidetes bacterium RIFOXYA12_FULL_33_9]OFY91254.1 MAG: phosphohydrolase [Bacteroidetes bacterium RIFOXYA2_FULL_33_7]HBF87936.1 phosphohydrolase [Bacteroidales bacterium]